MTTNVAKSATIVVNLRRTRDYDVRIDRQTVWGNPFVVGRDGDRADVIAKFREWATAQKWLMERVGELKGKRLACWCAPLPCHGDVLAELAEAS